MDTTNMQGKPVLVILVHHQSKSQHVFVIFQQLTDKLSTMPLEINVVNVICVTKNDIYNYAVPASC